MAGMSPYISWAVFLTVVGVVYYFSQSKQQPTPLKKAEPLLEKAKATVTEKAKAVANAGSNETKKSKKKAKKNTPAPAPVPTKEVVSTDDAGNESDDDVAEEIDLKEVARRMKGTAKTAAKTVGNKARNLAPAVASYATSQTSSTGADGDIDEEDSTPLSHSADPSDMLEASTGGPGVLRIGAPTQVPKGQKQKKAATTTEAGLHASKNAKKKEKEKAARAAERAEQQARFEQHRKTMRAEEAKQKPIAPAASAPIASAWAEEMSKPASFVPPTSTSDNWNDLLDTFTAEQSENQKSSKKSPALGESWESIPQQALVAEPEWNEVKKKVRAPKKMDDSDARSADEAKPTPAPAPKPKTPVVLNEPVKSAPRPAAAKKASTNNFSALTTSESDWAEIDRVDNWEVHPESSDY